MSTITTIASGDLITNSRTVIDNNFSALNTDKIETSYLDTDTTLAANSDAKIASQKATKAYADSIIGVNASETVKGVVEEATAAQIVAGTDTGETGARLFAVPSKLNTQIDAKIAAATPSLGKVVGALENSFVKTYFNIQLPFIMWTGSVDNDTTTTFDNWVRTDGTDVIVKPGGAMADFVSTGTAILSLENPLFEANADSISFNDTNIIILDWWAKLPSSGTGDINMGFVASTSDLNTVYTNVATKVAFCQRGSTGVLYATISNAVGTDNTDISSGLTVTNWNNYRIELDLSNNALFYVNGVLKATLSGTNFPSPSGTVSFGFGRSDTSLFTVTAPNLSLQMNP